MSKYALVRKKAVMQTLICLIISENKSKKVRGNMGNSNSGRYGGKLKREQCISLNIKILNRKKFSFMALVFLCRGLMEVKFQSPSKMI